MAQSEYQAQIASVEVYRGMNERTIPANLEVGEYTRTKGVCHRYGRAGRIPGKVLSANLGVPIIQIFQFNNNILIQIPGALKIAKIQDFFPS